MIYFYISHNRQTTIHAVFSVLITLFIVDNQQYLLLEINISWAMGFLQQNQARNLTFFSAQTIMFVDINSRMFSFWR